MKTITVSGITVELTEEKRRRIHTAIFETQEQIAREMKYSEDLRKCEDVAKWQKHIEYLESLLS